MTGQIGHFRFPEPDRDGDQVEPAEPDPRTGRASGQSAAKRVRRLPVLRSIKTPKQLGVALAVGTALLLAILSFQSFYGLTIPGGGPSQDCAGITNPKADPRCVHKGLGYEGAAHFYWNAWGSYFSWIPVLLLLMAGVAVGLKALFFRSPRVALNRFMRLALLFGDALFLVALLHIPHNNIPDGHPGRAWALWLSLICVIALNSGVLLASTDIGERVAERWSRRQSPAAAQSQPATPPATPPVAMPPQTPRQTNPYPANQGFQVDYRPGPQQVPQQREPEQTGWPQQPPQQSGGFPTQGEQR